MQTLELCDVLRVPGVVGPGGVRAGVADGVARGAPPVFLATKTFSADPRLFVEDGSGKVFAAQLPVHQNLLCAVYCGLDLKHQFNEMLRWQAQ